MISGGRPIRRRRVGASHAKAARRVYRDGLPLVFPEVPMPVWELNLRLQVGAHPLRIQASLCVEGLLKAKRRSAPYVMMLAQSHNGLSCAAGRARNRSRDAITVARVRLQHKS